MRKWGLIVAVAAVAAVAVSGPAHSAIGVGVRWGQDAGLVPNMVLPVKMASGMIVEPEVGFASSPISSGLTAATTASTRRATQIRLGVGVEKAMKSEGTSGLFGARALVHINTFSNTDFKSRLDLAFGVYIGGTAKLADGVDIVGTWGPSVGITGKQKVKSSSAESDSQTSFGSTANLTIRFWLWNM